MTTQPAKDYNITRKRRSRVKPGDDEEKHTVMRQNIPIIPYYPHRYAQSLPLREEIPDQVRYDEGEAYLYAAGHTN
jgi:hypothetical protein